MAVELAAAGGNPHADISQLGEQCLPQKWLDGLELREVITELADDLFDCPQWCIGMDAKSEDFDKRVWEKYPGY